MFSYMYAITVFQKQNENQRRYHDQGGLAYFRRIKHFERIYDQDLLHNKCAKINSVQHYSPNQMLSYPAKFFRTTLRRLDKFYCIVK